MKEQIKGLDFTGHKIFVGIDVHLRQWTITIRTFNIVLRTFSMNPSPQELFNHLNKNYPNADYHSVYEAGFCGFWAHRELLRFGIKNIVVNPADVPTTHKEKTQKRDKRDSRKLAKELSGGSMEAINVPELEQESLRLLSRRLLQISKATRRAKVRIKHFLHTQGIHIPRQAEMSHWSKRFIHWLKSIKFEQQYSRYYLDELLDDLEFYRTRKLVYLRKIRTIMKGNKTMYYLRTIPGIGFITAFILYTEIMDIFRFQKSDQLIAFVGLIPSVYGSDEKEKILGLTNRCNKYLRYLIIESSWVAVRKDPALTMAYQRFIKDRKPQKAIIRIAKKLVKRIRYVWINQQEYKLAVVK
jgi:transposase